MRRYDVVTLFPELVHAVAESGIPAQAKAAGLYGLQCWNPRDFAGDRHRTVDDRPYGGGPGMVMTAAPLLAAIRAAKAAVATAAPCIYLSPQGRRLDQAGVERLAEYPRLVLVAGRYEGVDERVVELEIDAEWSIGDYVLSGGELPAMVLMDALIRRIPGALGHDDSAAQDSFASRLLDHPHYTRPERIEGLAVPEVLLGGNHQAIARWRRRQALRRTARRRPELLAAADLSAADRALLATEREDDPPG